MLTWIRNYVNKKLFGYILTNISYGSSILAWIIEKFNLKRNLLWHGGAGEIVWRELSNYHNKAKKHTTAWPLNYYKELFPPSYFPIFSPIFSYIYNLFRIHQMSEIFHLENLGKYCEGYRRLLALFDQFSEI